MASNEKLSNFMVVDKEKVVKQDKEKPPPNVPCGDTIEQMTEILSVGDGIIKRPMPKVDSGISEEKSDDSSDEDISKKQKTAAAAEKPDDAMEGSSFPKVKPKSKSRNYRGRKPSAEIFNSSDEDGDTATKAKLEEGRDSLDSGHQESNSPVEDVVMAEDGTTHRDSEHSEGDSDDTVLLNDLSDIDMGEEESASKLLLKPKPKPRWFATKEVVYRQIGVSSRMQGADLFQRRCYGSLRSVQRLELMYKLESHNGCVNALNFSHNGGLLASGSDDLKVAVWDWAVGKLLTTYDSGHRSNVFQVKFLPLTGSTHVVSCSRDGQIRLMELSPSGETRSSRRLAAHRGAAHKLCVQPDQPHVVLSSGEDAVVMSIDVRETKPTRLLTVKEGERKVPLYSVHSNPLNWNQFCVSGRNKYIHTYDRRRIQIPLAKYCPKHLVGASTNAHVTCAVYSPSGSEVLGSYNDEDIYLFDTSEPTGLEFVHRYQGHRNSATVKGVNFFGPKGEFVVSGSDCGYIYFWDRETESIVQWMPGDENGVVNCLEPHPQVPVLATSGLDSDIKVWVSSCEQDPSLAGLASAVQANARGRNDDMMSGPYDPDSFDGQMLWILWRQIRRAERRRQAMGTTTQTRASTRATNPPPEGNASSSTSDSDSNSDSESDADEPPVQCSPS